MGSFEKAACLQRGRGRIENSGKELGEQEEEEEEEEEERMLDNSKGGKGDRATDRATDRDRRQGHSERPSCARACKHLRAILFPTNSSQTNPSEGGTAFKIGGLTTLELFPGLLDAPFADCSPLRRSEVLSRFFQLRME